MTSETTPLRAANAMDDDDYDTLDTLLDDLRTRDDETPQWEFFEGFMAALVCCRRPIPEAEYWPVLLGIDLPQGDAVPGLFKDADQYQQFMALWTRRMLEVRTALDTPVETLEDDRVYAPEVSDMRGIVAALPPQERAELGDGPIQSLGQIWAVGFMYAVESWPDEWDTPRDRDAAKIINAALDCILTITEDDNEPLTIASLDGGDPPGMSQKRLDDFAAAIWAVYDLYEIWHAIGPRVETVVVGDKPGRNDPCSCGSGKKYKKCCGV